MRTLEFNDMCVLNFEIHCQIAHLRGLTIYIFINDVGEKKSMLLKVHVLVSDKEVVLYRI